MSQLTERDAEKLSPEQATALVRVIELQARWDGLLADKKPQTSSLQARQKASDAYQAALRNYGAKYPKASTPEPTHAVPDRLVVWFRVLRTVFGKAEGGSPVEVMGKVYRLADRIAERLGETQVERSPVTDLPGAVQELDKVIAWCDALVPPPKSKKSEAA